MKEIRSIADFSLPEEGFVNIPRQHEEDIQIPIRALSYGKSQELIAAHAAPAPPKKFDKTGRLTATGKPGWYFDENDSVHQGLVREKSMEQTTALALAAIAIPDLTEEALKKFLTMGDISIIVDAVNELSNISDEQIEQVKNFSESE